MKNLIIIGARGYGREVYNVALLCKEYGNDWTIKGFLDDKADALEGFKGYSPIISSVEDYKPGLDDVFICALGEVIYKKKYCEIILAKKGNFINIIHPSVKLGRNSTIGTGCIILENSMVSSDVSIGNFVTIQTAVAIGHDVSIGDYSYLNTFSFLGGFVKVEEGATVFPGACILPRLTIGSQATVGAGSVVVKNVKPRTTVFGNPARVISE